MAASLLPLVCAVCALVLVRQGFERFAPDVAWWIAFVSALVVGYAVYWGVERLMRRRQGGSDPRNGPSNQS
jgi:membrane protein implicated in regulation of membrane protease activity